MTICGWHRSGEALPCLLPSSIVSPHGIDLFQNRLGFRGADLINVFRLESRPHFFLAPFKMPRIQLAADDHALFFTLGTRGGTILQNDLLARGLHLFSCLFATLFPL